MAQPFTPAWLADDPRATQLLPRRFAHAAGRAAAVRQAADRRADPAVLAAVEVRSEAQRVHREALARAGSTCVVTGQQAGLFGGPLYTVHKAAAAIVNARALEQETGIPCVPVFWLQDEDHDFAEIASAHVLGADDRVATFTVEEAPGDADRSIFARTLGPSVVDALEGLRDHLGDLPHAGGVLERLSQAYTPERSPSAAFAELVHDLFADHGLLVVDPAALPGPAEAFHLRAFEAAEAWSAVLEARSRALDQAGFRVQIHVRPAAPLSFVHPEGREGPRYRVEPTDEPGQLRLCGTPRTLPADRAASGPFSTSALLRPLLQDTWLPTAAYVGGPGEIAYFAQLPPLYEAAGVPMPLIVPRASFRVVDTVSRRLLGQLGLSPEALTQPSDALLAKVAAALPSGAPSPEQLEASLVQAVTEVLQGFQGPAGELDPGLAKSVRKTMSTMNGAATKLVERYRRTLSRHDEVTMDRLTRVQHRLAPHGAPAERVHSWPSVAARYGVAGYVQRVLDAVVPFDGTLRDLDPDVR